MKKDDKHHRIKGEQKTRIQEFEPRKQEYATEKYKKLERDFQFEDLEKITKEKKRKKKWLFLINKLMGDAKETNFK